MRGVVIPEVTVFGPSPSGARMVAFATPDGLRVTVCGSDEDSNWAAHSLAVEFATTFAAEPTCYADLRDWSREERIEWVAARLVAGNASLGARLTAGLYTVAVKGDAPLFAVLGLRGEPLVLAHDAFETARAFVDAEMGDADADPACVVIEPDALLIERAAAERYAEQEWRYARYNAALAQARAEQAVSQ